MGIAACRAARTALSGCSGDLLHLTTTSPAAHRLRARRAAHRDEHQAVSRQTNAPSTHDNEVRPLARARLDPTRTHATEGLHSPSPVLEWSAFPYTILYSIVACLLPELPACARVAGVGGGEAAFWRALGAPDHPRPGRRRCRPQSAPASQQQPPRSDASAERQQQKQQQQASAARTSMQPRSACSGSANSLRARSRARAGASVPIARVASISSSSSASAGAERQQQQQQRERSGPSATMWQWSARQG